MKSHVKTWKSREATAADGGGRRPTRELLDARPTWVDAEPVQASKEQGEKRVPAAGGSDAAKSGPGLDKGGAGPRSLPQQEQQQQQDLDSHLPVCDRLSQLRVGVACVSADAPGIGVRVRQSGSAFLDQRGCKPAATTAPSQQSARVRPLRGFRAESRSFPAVAPLWTHP